MSLLLFSIYRIICVKKIKVSQQTKPNQKYRFHITPILLIQEFATTCDIQINVAFSLIGDPQYACILYHSEEIKKISLFS